MTGRRVAHTARLRDWLRERRGLDLADAEALRRWSVDDVGRFWQTLWEHFELPALPPGLVPLADARMPGARWFEGAELNYAAVVARRAADADACGAPAMVFRNERLQREGRSVELGWRELVDAAARVAARLESLGVGRGDRVCAYLPNVPEAAIAFLATASLGAVWSMTAPDMGAETVRDRFAQIEPTVLIACDGTVYGGRTVDRRRTVETLLAGLPSVQAVVVVPYLEAAGGIASGLDGWRPAGFSGTTLTWSDALAEPRRVAPRPMPFDHPLWIVYSSGTTGLPKAIVHGHGGIVLEMLKLHRFHLDLDSGGDERLLWHSSTGWVMWNLQLSALLLGATVCIYDGHPSQPRPDELWRVAAATRATFLGAGAAFHAACLKSGVDVRAAFAGEGADPARLRSLGSTGSPLSPECYAWGREQLGEAMWWAVISGGTDIASAFLGGTPELPTIDGEMQMRCLGADIEAWDEQGRPRVGEVGELVCRQPMPSMPLFFWNDADGRRYRDSYFDVYPGVWRHGDWLLLTPAGGAVVHGRSDATLNRHGHRLGTSELYRVVEAVPQVLDSLAVDLEVPGRPTFMPLFVVLREGIELDAALEAALRARIREALSPRFVPDAIVRVAEIPRTLTGKKQELPVKKLMLGRPLDQVVNVDACANPRAFDVFVAYAADRRDPGP